MTTAAPHYEYGYTTEATLFVAFELSEKTQIPPDLVANSQIIDIIEVIQSPIGRKNVVKALGRNRKSRCERLSTSEDYWSTT